MLLYLCYIMLFLTIILMQLRLGSSFYIKSEENQRIMTGIEFDTIKHIDGTGTGSILLFSLIIQI